MMAAMKFALLILCLALPLTAAAADSGKADGKLTINGKTRKFTHAYAVAVMTSTREMYYRVFLTDVPLTDEQIGLFPDVLNDDIVAGKVHVIRIGIDNSRKIDSVDIFDSEGQPSITTPNKLELTTFNETAIAGRLHLDKPYTDIGGTYQYDVKFSAPLRPESDFLP